LTLGLVLKIIRTLLFGVDKAWISLLLFLGHSLVYQTLLDEHPVNQEDRFFSIIQHDHHNHNKVCVKLCLIVSVMYINKEKAFHSFPQNAKKAKINRRMCYLHLSQLDKFHKYEGDVDGFLPTNYIIQGIFPYFSRL
jgi:hypothetical protein